MQRSGLMDSGGDTFAAVARNSLSEQAYQQIRKALMVGELKPGQKLNGRDIAVRLGTSLTPVREALLQMVAEGVPGGAGRGSPSLSPCLPARCMPNSATSAWRWRGLAPNAPPNMPR